MPAATVHRYLIALGSNVRHQRYGRPRDVVAAAVVRMQDEGLQLETVSPIIPSLPLGPSRRRFANAAAVVATGLEPRAVLAMLKRIEADFGRRRGRRWAARVIDLDLILWNCGAFAAADLLIPHPEFRNRAFVLDPAAAIVGEWRDPVSHRTVRQLAARLRRPGAKEATCSPLPRWHGA